MKQSSPMVRKAPMRRTAIVNKPKPSPGPKLKKCANRACRAPYMPDPKRPFLNWCCDDCGTVIGLEKLSKQKIAKQKVERADDKKRLDAYKTIPQLKAEAQKVFNTFIRLRDDDQPCICCGEYPTQVEALTGGAWHAGHWRSTGSADHLRYHEDNCHKQRAQCNLYGAGRAVDYAINLEKKIGTDRFNALRNDSTIIKWTREMLEEIKARYAAKIKELKKAMK